MNAAAQATPPSLQRLGERVGALVSHYRRVQHERMHDVPLLHPGLSVEAVGFAWCWPVNEDEGPVAEGILITPWFMSLVRLPDTWQNLAHRVGRSVTRDFGNERFDFLGAHDAALGYHESCALFSPMGMFASQDAARDTAREALALTRPAPEAAPPATHAVPTTDGMPARRGFLLGRSRMRA